MLQYSRTVVHILLYFSQTETFYKALPLNSEYLSNCLKYSQNKIRWWAMENQWWCSILSSTCSYWLFKFASLAVTIPFEPYGSVDGNCNQVILLYQALSNSSPSFSSNIRNTCQMTFITSCHCLGRSLISTGKTAHESFPKLYKVFEKKLSNFCVRIAKYLMCKCWFCTKPQIVRKMQLKTVMKFEFPLACGKC